MISDYRADIGGLAFGEDITGDETLGFIGPAEPTGIGRGFDDLVTGERGYKVEIAAGAFQGNHAIEGRLGRDDPDSDEEVIGGEVAATAFKDVADVDAVVEINHIEVVGPESDVPVSVEPVRHASHPLGDVLELEWCPI